MITQEGYDQVTGESGSQIDHKDYMELIGLSTDTKPTDVANGSTFIEMDTGTLYLFDAENLTWHSMS